MSEFVQRLNGFLPEGVVHRVHAVDEKSEDKKDISQKHSKAYKSRKSSNTLLQRLRGGPLTALLVTASTFFALWWISSLLPAQEYYEEPPAIPSKFLQVAIPVNRLYDEDLCKTVLSAQILNYPVPMIVPWGNASDGTPVAKDKRVYHRVARIYAYLSSLPVEAEDAITILLDGPDSWFQLRPEQLLQSYYQVIARADRNLENTYGVHIPQRVVFSAFRQCGSTATDEACTVVPDPPSPDLPRYVGHGAIVGPAKDLLAIVRRALNKLETTTTPPTKLLPVYGELFAEQEKQRSKRPKRVQQQNRHKRDNTIEQRSPASDTKIDTSAELGITLDYYNELGWSVGAEDEPFFQEAKLRLEELRESVPPFWTVSGREPDLPHNTTWYELQLLTTNTSLPAMIHHWPTVSMGGKDPTWHRRDWWPYFWMVEHARKLYTAAERLPATVVAQVTDNDGREVMFWNRQPAHNKAGAWLPNGQFFHFQLMCQAEAHWYEVFRDELGPWRRTDFF